MSAVSRLGHTSLDARRSHNTRRPGGGLSAAALMVHGSGYSQAPRPLRQGQGDTLAAAPSPSLPSLPSAAGNAAEAASHSPREPGGGAGGGGGGQLAAPGQGTGPQVVLSLKVMVTAGTVCAFHVGGGQEAALDDVAGLPVSCWLTCCAAGVRVCWVLVPAGLLAVRSQLSSESQGCPLNCQCLSQNVCCLLAPPYSAGSFSLATRRSHSSREAGRVQSSRR